MTIKSLFSNHRALLKQIENHRERLYRVAYSWCHDEMLAEDLVHETLLCGIQKVSDLRNPGALTGWLFAILNNQWRQYLRQRKPQVDIDELVFESEESPLETTDFDQKRRGIRQLIARLPVGQRQTITMVDLEDMSYDEVSQALNIPIGTVMSRLSRARSFLTQHMQRQQQAELPPMQLRAAHLRRVK